MKTILLLEDDQNLNKGITLTLQKEGYHVYSAHTISEAEAFLKRSPELLICDITLPDGNGLDFGKRVIDTMRIGLIYLTAMDSEIDIVNGYLSGADDYVTKPFSLTILSAKVQAVIRRLDGREVSKLTADHMEVNMKNGQVYRDGELVSLSKTEYALLIYLMENAGQILSKGQILERIWGMDGQFVDEGAVAVNISRLKNKLGIGNISNVRGLGYLWDGNVSKA
ncbi:MAG: response regulator transcription factor [Lachnospiraceae bacterium]|nr:response regulator transcription factor [Lachnospiraceae bacterium]